MDITGLLFKSKVGFMTRPICREKNGFNLNRDSGGKRDLYEDLVPKSFQEEPTGDVRTPYYYEGSRVE